MMEEDEFDSVGGDENDCHLLPVIDEMTILYASYRVCIRKLQNQRFFFNRFFEMRLREGTMRKYYRQIIIH